jgi:N,N'-diacetyllegionaminate synthase
MKGWDHAISANPEQMKVIVEEGRNIFSALGNSRRIVTRADFEKRKKFRRSLVASRALPKGHVLAMVDLDAKRPGTGIAPNETQYVLGRKLARDIEEDQVIQWEHLM